MENLNVERVPRGRWGLIFLLACGAHAANTDNRWNPPDFEVPLFSLPLLKHAPTLDGDLTEWQDAAVVPARCAACIAVPHSARKWGGPADASMSLLAGWCKKGLCLAAAVADNEVFSVQRTNEFWRQDGVEIFVDGRATNALGSAGYDAGAFQVCIRAPLKPRAEKLPHEPALKGIELVGKKTREGYVVEMLIPWSLFPKLDTQAGARMGLQFAMDDYDPSDAEPRDRLQMAGNGDPNLWRDASKFSRWILAPAGPQDPRALFDLSAFVRATQIITTAQNIPITVDRDCATLPSVATIDLTIKDWRGKAVFTKRWQSRADEVAEKKSFVWRLGSAPDGIYVLTLAGKDRAGQFVGAKTQPLLVVRNMLQWICSYPLARTAQRAPFKARAFAGVLACAERLRSCKKFDATAAWLGMELESRLEVFKNGRGGAKLSGLLDALNLAAIPESQVAVAFPNPAFEKEAVVSFYCGGIPLAAGAVHELATEAAARTEVENTAYHWLVEMKAPATLDGLAGCIITQRYDFAVVAASNINPDCQVLLCNFDYKQGLAVSTGRLDSVRPQAITLLPSCRPNSRSAIAQWAEAQNIPVLSLEEGLKTNDLLVAGDFRASPLQDKLEGFEFYEATPRPAGVTLMFPSSNRVISGSGCARAVAEQVVRLIRKGNPVELEEVDRLRRAVVQSLAKPAALSAPPEGMSLFCGDVHMHTTHSDGQYPPPAVVLESLYCGMDFCVISDHNTLEGAQRAQGVFGACGFGNTIVVGEEITTSREHYNAYPLETVISPELPPYEMIKAAHVQGAVIQWNHPSIAEGERSRYVEQGLDGMGLDAWEHLPPYEIYQAWQKQPRRPVIVGSTDSHNGLFDDVERTLILAPTPTGPDLAEAIRRKAALMVNPCEPGFFCGSEAMAAIAVAALENPAAMRATHTQRLKNVFKNCNLKKLLRED